MIARTEISRVQNTGILQSYINEGYTEVKILTAEDNHVCDLCLRYAFEYNNNDDITFENRGVERVHNIIKLIEGGLFPPFHPICRCTYLSVWKSGRKTNCDSEIIDLVNYNSNITSSDKFNESAIHEFNNLKNDSNIEWSINKNINFHRKELNNDEIFIKYHFKDTDITIYKSLSNTSASVKEIHDFLKKYPELMVVCKEVVLSNQSITEKVGDETQYIGGFTRKNNLERIHILNQPKLSLYDIKLRIIHELAHTIDGKLNFYSSHPDYIKAYGIDKSKLDKITILDEKDRHVTEYAYKFTLEALAGGKGNNRPYSEDFAECVKEYYTNPENFIWKFPEKAKYINSIFHKYNIE